MKRLTVRNLLLSLAVVATLLPSCKKDEEYSLILDERIALIEEPGGQASIGYTAYGLASVSATTIPQGWTITVNTDERRIYITAPTLFGDESVTTTEEGEETEPNVKYGTAIITGRTSGNSSVSSSLYVSVADQVDFSDEPSNSYILTKSNTRYCIDATQKGENGGTISPASVAILWQTPYKLLEYPRLADGKAYVFFTTGEDDDDNPVFNSGNAVLGAFDAAGELLWTWHLWCTENDPRNETVELGGETAMKRNLGALTISGTSEEDILDIVRGQQTREDSAEGVIVYSTGGRPITARSENQRRMVEAYDTHDLIFAIGPAGSGKTYTGIALAVRALKNKEIKKIILCRPAVEAGEKLGFLPGDMKEKIDPYLQPLYDALEEMIPPGKLRDYLETNIIQIAPLAFMRGRTLNDAVVILDEAQNTTTSQIKMFLTRMGTNTKMIVTGDRTQIDLPPSQRSGLVEATRILAGVPGIAFIEMNKKDIVRHKLVTRIVEAYERDARERRDGTRQDAPVSPDNQSTI